MPDNKDLPAYPWKGIGAKGLTKRELISSNAPNEIPDWFECSYSIGKPKEPKAWDEFSDSDSFKEEIKQWHRSQGDWDLPEELQWYQKEWEKYHSELGAYNTLIEQERYFSWRVFYADNLLNHLQNTDK